MVSTYRLYRFIAALPYGQRLFSAVYRHKAPYFSSVALRVEHMGEHIGRVHVPHRRQVLNHIGTIHAIAACNGLEAAMGLLAEATCPNGYRWLPKGMDVNYIAKSDGPLTCIASSTPSDWQGGPDVPIAVRAELADGTVTVEGTIKLWVTAR